MNSNYRQEQESNKKASGLALGEFISDSAVFGLRREGFSNDRDIDMSRFMPAMEALRGLQFTEEPFIFIARSDLKPYDFMGRAWLGPRDTQLWLWKSNRPVCPLWHRLQFVYPRVHRGAVCLQPIGHGVNFFRF